MVQCQGPLRHVDQHSFGGALAHVSLFSQDAIRLINLHARAGSRSVSLGRYLGIHPTRSSVPS